MALLMSVAYVCIEMHIMNIKTFIELPNIEASVHFFHANQLKLGTFIEERKQEYIKFTSHPRCSNL